MLDGIEPPSAKQRTCLPERHWSVWCVECTIIDIKKIATKNQVQILPSLERTDRDPGDRFMPAIASELKSLTADIKFLRNLIALLACIIRL